MPRLALRPSPVIADLLKQGRGRSGLTLRDVERRSQSYGELIPFTTLGKIERGKVDPGIKRLHVLLRLYNIPIGLAGELLDLETFAPELAENDRSIPALREKAVEQWKRGDVRSGLAYLVALRSRSVEEPTESEERQRTLLTLASMVGSMGKYHLSQEIVHGLLLEGPLPKLLPRILLQAAVCWHWLGSVEVALALLDRADTHVAKDDHKQRAWLLHERASANASAANYHDAESALRRAFTCYRAAKDLYGEGRLLGVEVRIHMEQQKFSEALSAARRARKHAERNGFARLCMMREIDEGQALLGLHDYDAAVTVVNKALTEAITQEDGVLQFYGHHALWRIHLAQGDPQRADVELQAARYYMRYVDEVSREAAEVREASE